MDNQQCGITREDARALMEEKLQEDGLRKHSLAAEAIMRALAPRFGADAETWGLVGVLHDLDYNETKEQMDRHGLLTERMLLERGVDPGIAGAIKYHNAENLGLVRSDPVHFALTAGETITGMIIAAALVNPEKRIAALKAKSIKKRMKAKEFARSVNRDHIRLCEDAGIPLDEFIVISLEAMAGIHEELGL